MTYLKSEMVWYVNFLDYRARQCEDAAEAKLKVGGEHAAHELREASMWRSYAREARMKFGWKVEEKLVKEEEVSDMDIGTDDEGQASDLDAE